MTTIFNQQHTCFIHNENSALILSPNLIYLPQHPVDQREIYIYNQNNTLITINSNSRTDLIYSSFAAPNGSQTVSLEPNRMLLCKYLLTDNKRKTGIWHVIRS